MPQRRKNSPPRSRRGGAKTRAKPRAKKRVSRRTAAVRRPALSRPSRRRAGASTRREEPVMALSFEAGDERSGRVGDAKSFEEQQALYPPRRVREAGLTGGETPARNRVTADDAAPATLIDEGGGANPADVRVPSPADTALSIVDASAIGAGGGRDEAEDAQVDPLSPAELRRIRRRIARSGASLTEPNESRAGSPGRRRNRRAQ